MLLRYLSFNESIENAVRAPRIHHQLAPMRLEYENGFDDNIIDGLQQIGHQIFKTPSDGGFAALTAIGRKGKQIVPIFDQRRKGSVEVF